MDWHPTPKDDAWKQAHLAMLERLGKDAWLRCDGCAHTVMVKPRDFAERHRLDMLTPLLTISRRSISRRMRSAEGRLSAGAARHEGKGEGLRAGRYEGRADPPAWTLGASGSGPAAKPGVVACWTSRRWSSVGPLEQAVEICARGIR